MQYDSAITYDNAFAYDAIQEPVTPGSTVGGSGAPWFSADPGVPKFRNLERWRALQQDDELIELAIILTRAL